MNIASVSLFVMASMAPPSLASVDAPESRIMGGEPAKACTWPTTVSIKHCTATLIHPEVIIYAAHCGSNVPNALFGESTGGPARQVATKYCKTNPNFSMAAGPGKGTDFAFCVLKEPVKEMPIAPILYGCEMEALKEKAVIWLAGFGKNDNSSGGPKSGVKHRVETDFVKYRNAEKKEVVVGSNGKTACNGDSGGPAYIQLDDGTWRTFGITSHGVDTSCTKVAYYTNAEIMVPWMQEEIKKAGDDHIDVTPCFDDDGTWNPSEQCGGFAKDYETSYGSWDNFCSEGAPRGKASSTCGEPNPKAGGGSDDAGDEESGDKEDGKEGPKLELRSPKDGASFELGEEVEVEVVAKGDSDDIEKVVLHLDGEAQKADKKSPYTWTLKDLEAGEHELYATAETESGAKSKSKTLSFTVKADKEDPDGSDVPEDKDKSKSDDPKDKDKGDDKGGDKDKEDPEDPGADKGPGGCSVDSPALGWSAWLLMLALPWRRRQRKQ